MSTTPSHPAGWLLVTSEGAWHRLRADRAWRFADKTLPRAQSLRTGDLAVVGNSGNYGMYLQGQALKPLNTADFALLRGAVEAAR